MNKEKFFLLILSGSLQKKLMAVPLKSLPPPPSPRALWPSGEKSSFFLYFFCAASYSQRRTFVFAVSKFSSQNMEKVVRSAF